MTLLGEEVPSSQGCMGMGGGGQEVCRAQGSTVLMDAASTGLG